MTQRVMADPAIQIPSTLVGTQWPGVAVVPLILRDGKVLMGYRVAGASTGAGFWGSTGGKLEFGETFEDCARRETKEECGLDLTNLRVGPVTNDILESEDKHFVTVFVLADAPEGEPQALENDKIQQWQWCDWDALPEPLFLPIQNLLKVSYSPFIKPMMVGLKALITNEQGQYLLFHRRDPRPGESHTIWEIPGGRMESGEEVPDALKREVQSETGLTVVKIGRCIGVQSILKNPKQHVVRNTFEVEVRGTPKAFGTNDEHDKAEWFTTQQIEGLTLDPYLREVFAVKLNKENT